MGLYIGLRCRFEGICRYSLHMHRSREQAICHDCATLFGRRTGELSPPRFRAPWLFLEQPCIGGLVRHCFSACSLCVCFMYYTQPRGFLPVFSRVVLPRRSPTCLSQTRMADWVLRCHMWATAREVTILCQIPYARFSCSSAHGLRASHSKGIS